MKEFVFYYDIVCPFAYAASRIVENLARRTNASIKWRPVLLGGLYDLSRAPQGKDGSAYSVMPQAKRRLLTKDFMLSMKRNGLSLTVPASHPQKTLNAMRLIASTEPDSGLRVKLTHSLYEAYWQKHADVTDSQVLQSIAASIGWSFSDIRQQIEQGRESLKQNTHEAFTRGAFGVPSFWVNDRLYWGVDRMHFVERVLGNESASPLRLAFPDVGRKGHLTFYYDFSSPWSYLGSQKIYGLLKSLAPIDVTVEWVPILVGALFKEIGTPVVPLLEVPEIKRAYGEQDLQDWIADAGHVPFRTPSTFPIRSVSALRVALVEKSDRLRDTIYKAAWVDDRDISKEDVLCRLLDESGFDGKGLLTEAQKPETKEQLRVNVARAISAGVIGVPSFQVNGNPYVIWGQDRMNVVADLLCGWTLPEDVVTLEANM
ncbi:uncharacterized protein [Oscarella lobularis]|uniref:uncharacterized protein isoform X2 n=1 Tax=Oscarella lobularis TaxID=121494 RepID=UPI0033134997